MVGGGAAGRIEPCDGRVALRHPGQPPEVIEDQRDRVIDRAWITNAVLPQHTPDDEHHPRHGQADQLFE